MDSNVKSITNIHWCYNNYAILQLKILRMEKWMDVAQGRRNILKLKTKKLTISKISQVLIKKYNFDVKDTHVGQRRIQNPVKL